MDKVEILVRAGIPGAEEDSSSEKPQYPISTVDFTKIARSHGLEVKYEHEGSERSFISLKSFDVWLPILDFTANVGANIPANIVATLIMDFFRARGQKAEDAVLHVKYLTKDKNGTERKFEGSGPGEQVLASIREFEKNVRK